MKPEPIKSQPIFSAEEQLQWIAAQPDVIKMAVMPDSHPGTTVPNGIVVATKELLYPQLVGSDIGCGYSAIRFNEQHSALTRPDLECLLDHLLRAVPTLKQTPAKARIYRDLIERLGPLSDERLVPLALRDGSYQLGTLGRGNHFLELAHDDAGHLWCVVHSGSRGIGQAISNHYVQMYAEIQRDQNLIGIPALSNMGVAYFADMNWGCQYATLNRSLILNALADLLEFYHSIEPVESTYIDSPHNFLATLECEQDSYFVHRKSANSAAANQLGIIAGSMATGSLITVGLGEPNSLQSSAHGAGRAMSRAEAIGKIRARDIDEQMGSIVYRSQDASRFRDEGPQAYKRLHDVMQAQKAQVRTVEKLTPILNDKRF